MPFGHTFVPRLLMTVSFTPVHAELLHDFGDLIGIAVATVDEDVDAGAQLHRRLAGRPDRQIHRGLVVLDRLETLRLLAETLDHGVGELFGADLLLRRSLFIDVVGVDAVFDGAQPRVVHALGDLGLRRCAPA